MKIKNLSLITFTFLFSTFHSNSFSQQLDSKLKLLTEKADIIVTGKVIGQKSNWNSDKSRIYSEATLQVDEYIKGENKGNSVLVTYPGGEVGGIGELYTHMPTFNKDEDILVFLKKDEKNMSSYKVYDGEEGKIKIIKDAKTGESITTSNVRIEDLKTQIKKYLTK